MFLVVILSLVLCMMFYTMVERKILSYMQSRKGPKKVGFLGLLKPVLDSVKLVLKVSMKPGSASKMFYSGYPVFLVILVIGSFYIVPIGIEYKAIENSVLWYFMMTSLTGLIMLLISYGSKKKYSLMGGQRVGAGVLSYEVGMMIILLLISSSVGMYSLKKMMGSSFIFLLFFLPGFFCWVVFGLMDLNRSPFDFAEGESELVSGIKVEYGAMGFAAFYLAEYGFMIFFAILTGVCWG